MNSVLTLVAPAGALDAAIVAEVIRALNGLGATAGDPAWLAEAEAVDIPFGGTDAPDADKTARGLDVCRGMDLFAGPAAARRKKLLMADMDATMVTSETLDDLAAQVGLKDKVAAITARAMNGELDFEAAVKERVGMLAGLSESALAETYADITLSPGAQTTVRTMRAHGAHCVLVSGGFTYFTSRVAEACGFDEHHANRLGIADAKLTGEVIEPILGKEAKLATLQRLAGERGLADHETIAVGDGANDLPMLKAAGLGVAYHGKPVVAEGADARIDHGSLTALLFFQGYRREEFAPQ